MRRSSKGAASRLACQGFTFRREAWSRVRWQLSAPRNVKPLRPPAAVARVGAADTWAERELRPRPSLRPESRLAYGPDQDKPSVDVEPLGSEFLCRYQLLRDAFAVPPGALSELRRGGRPRCMKRARKVA